MKIKRHKNFQKNVKFFMKHFEWKPPFNVVIDGTFAKGALDNKVNILDQLQKYFDSPIKLWTTPCCILEMEKLGPDLYGALQVLKSFNARRCPHSQTPVVAATCMKHVIRENKEDRLIPATQDPVLWKYFRGVPGTPIIHLNGPAPVFEKPSHATQACAEKKNLRKMEMLNYQKEILKKMKNEAFGEPETPEPKGTKKRKRKGPNPLSCKKSKKALIARPPGSVSDAGETCSASSSSSSSKKKRIRVKVPKHVKEELKKIKKNVQDIKQK